jgi:hypothetical protein
MARKAKAEAAPAPTDVLRLAGHPRAQRNIRRARGWAGLGAFALVAAMSLRTGSPLPDAASRGLVAGVVAYVAVWGASVSVWRHLLLAEVEAAHRRILQRAEKAAAEPATES